MQLILSVKKCHGFSRLETCFWLKIRYTLCRMHLYLFAYTYINIIIYALFKLNTRFVLWSWNFRSTLLRNKSLRLPKPFKYVSCLMRMLTWVTISANFHNCVLWIRCRIASLGANAGFCLVKGIGDFDSSGQSEVDRQPRGIPMPSSSGPPEWLQHPAPPPSLSVKQAL